MARVEEQFYILQGHLVQVGLTTSQWQSQWSGATCHNAEQCKQIIINPHPLPLLHSLLLPRSAPPGNYSPSIHHRHRPLAILAQRVTQA